MPHTLSEMQRACSLLSEQLPGWGEKVTENVVHTNGLMFVRVGRHECDFHDGIMAYQNEFLAFTVSYDCGSAQVMELYGLFLGRDVAIHAALAGEHDEIIDESETADAYAAHTASHQTQFHQETPGGAS